MIPFGIVHSHSSYFSKLFLWKFCIGIIFVDNLYLSKLFLLKLCICIAGNLLCTAKVIPTQPSLAGAWAELGNKKNVSEKKLVMEDILGQKSIKVWKVGQILIHFPPTYLSSYTNLKTEWKECVNHWKHTFTGLWLRSWKFIVHSKSNTNSAQFSWGLDWAWQKGSIFTIFILCVYFQSVYFSSCYSQTVNEFHINSHHIFVKTKYSHTVNE